MPATPPPDKAKPGPLPWLTLVASALVIVAWFWPGSFAALVYDRSLILSGQLWRLVTGHWVHFSGGHLFWNLVVLIPTGIWLERRNPTALRWTILLSPLAISFALLAFAPALSVYAGISGVASGVLVALGIDQVRRERTTRLWWLILLALFAVKVAIDFFTGQPLNPALAAQGIRSVPLAHLVGATVGTLSVLLCKPRNKTGIEPQLNANQR